MSMNLGSAIAAGTRSTVHRYGRNMVAKVPLATTPDSWIQYEALYTAAVRAAGAPAAKVIDVITIDGRKVGLYERIVGRSMWDDIVAAPRLAADYGRQLADVHLSIIALAAPLTVPHQRDRLAGKIRRAASMTDLELTSAMAQLPAGHAGTRLCHGDLHPANVLMAESGPVVIDWFDACRGLAVADVARSSLLLGAGGATTDSVPHLDGSTDGVLCELHGSYLSVMLDQLGCSPAEFEAWRRIEAAARLSEGLAPDGLLSIWHGSAQSAAC
jgi:Phosphotransferase enzyme family